MPPPATTSLSIPGYLERVYWWAYVHPRAVRLFEREWLVNTILMGNYARLRDAMLNELGAQVRGDTLQVACVYGDFSNRLQQRLGPKATLDVIDILPIQLNNLTRKLPEHPRVTLRQNDSSALSAADASYDQVLLFFLLHEQPEAVRRATLSEAMRVVKPGGKVVLVDYHRPRWWHPARPLLWAVLRTLEPFALDLWKHDLEAYLPQQRPATSIIKVTYFGAMYQKLVLTR